MPAAAARALTYCVVCCVFVFLLSCCICLTGLFVLGCSKCAFRNLSGLGLQATEPRDQWAGDLPVTQFRPVRPLPGLYRDQPTYGLSAIEP